MKYRVVTTDYAEDGKPRLEHHEAVETFDEARMHADQLKGQHAIVSVYRYSGGEPDLLWSSRAE